ncbi:MAG: hypothetical protein ACRDY7_00135 [Acidimicrobiia bacterium]
MPDDQPGPGGGADERFTQISHTLDRLLTLAMDHGQGIADLRADVSEVRTGITQVRGDMSQVRVEMAQVRVEMAQVRHAFDGVQEALTEHLGWHLGQQGRQ